jgi:1-acyl-sn-glycerol-3-phosphate acyltransferase
LVRMTSPSPKGYPRRGRRMLRVLGRATLKLFGWRITDDMPELSKLILVVAPHTSNWDFPVGVAAMFALDLDAHWMGKESLFSPPIGFFMRALGGRPVRRDTPEGLVSQMVAIVSSEPRFMLAIAPEGTRSKVTNWRTGFYRIAEATGMPMVPVWFDWSRHEIGIGQPVYASGQLDREVSAIKALYRPEMARYPDAFWEDEPAAS